MTESSDSQLIKDYFAGDEASFGVLVKRYLKPIYRLALRYAGEQEAAEDITQEVFIRVWRNLKKFDSDKSFKTWIFSISKNASIDFLKKKKAIPISRFEGDDGNNFIMDNLADPHQALQEVFGLRDFSGALKSALSKLSPPSRDILNLRYNNDLTFREISASLGKPLNTVKSIHRRALKALRGIVGI